MKDMIGIRGGPLMSDSVSYKNDQKEKNASNVIGMNNKKRSKCIRNTPRYFWCEKWRENVGEPTSKQRDEKKMNISWIFHTIWTKPKKFQLLSQRQTVQTQ